MASAQELTEKGFDLARQGKLKKALNLFQKAYEKDPNWVDGLYGQGAVHYKSGNYEIAREIFSRVLDQRPTHEKALKYLNKCDDIIEETNPPESPFSYAEDFSVEKEKKDIYQEQIQTEAEPPMEESDRDWSHSDRHESPVENGAQEIKKGQQPQEEKKYSLGMLRILLLNLVLLTVAGMVIFAMKEVITQTDLFSADKSVAVSEEYNEPSASAPDAPEDFSVEETAPVTSPGTSSFTSGLGSILWLLGRLLTFSTWLVFLWAAFSESFLKGALCFCCFVYLWIFVLLEYKSENKKLWVSLHIIGVVLSIVGEGMT